jgi:lipopolysaccharide/colanic/teichoic acid biosynthesis glycosyltransferase
MIREGIERMLAAGAAVILLPLLLLTALAVWLSLGRPLLFRQQRSGLEGQPFELVKFRTMRQPEKGADPLGHDAERTPFVGRLLRRTRLDELPQLVNVVRGDVAIVGPRPLLPATIAALGERGRLRGRVKPGLTGWAQTHGGPQLTEPDKIALDLWYIENRSLWLDMTCLALTVRVILFGDRPDLAATEVAHARTADRRS